MRWLIFTVFLVATALHADARRERLERSSLESSIGTADANQTFLELNIDVHNVKARNETSPYLYGLMFEDINYSGDGGIYAELIKNRAFQGSNITQLPSLTAWASIGDVKLSLDDLHPLSNALPIVMKVEIAKSATGKVGFKNFGWWGMDVRPQTYSASFYVSADAVQDMSKSTHFTMSIQSNKTGEIWASSTLSDVEIPSDKFVQLNSPIVNTKTAPDADNSFAITMDASQVAGQTLYFNLVSLFPETFKGRKNGLRKDIGEAFYDMRPKFLRFPGGNNLEGVSEDTRWKWWKTIGPLVDRPGRPGNWGYQNTDGLGLLEYLEWCEDMSITPILAIYAGFSLSGGAGTSYPASRMHEVIQEALDELEYCMGATTTKYGALRASHGHPAPFEIKFVEIGNEDWFSNTYPMRWGALYPALKKAYPDITFISTALEEVKGRTVPLPSGTIWDTHHYEEPHYFLENFNFYDNWQERTNNTGVGVFLGEYSVYQGDTAKGIIEWGKPKDSNHMYFPKLVSAIAEGVYALGGERNPDVVRMSSYAPSLQNINSYQWDPNMIHYTAKREDTVLSASYWQQWLFARYRGTHTLPVTNKLGSFNPLFWAASIDVPTNTVYFKIINSSPNAQSVALSLPQYTRVNGTILTSDDLYAFNSVANQNRVVPRPLEITLNAQRHRDEGRLELQVKGWSLNVLEFKLT